MQRDAIADHWKRRAVTMVVVVIFGALVGLGVAALAVDTGVMYSARRELQGAADASALAGASGLLEGETTIKNRAIEYAGNNKVAGTAVTAGDLSIMLGNWDGRNRVFHAATGWEPTTPNSVQISATRTNLSLFFARFVGINDTVVNRAATALVGGGECLGVWGLNGVSGSGNLTTDSYDSTNGLYGPGSIHPNGDICSCQGININGSIEIQGDAMFGEGYSVDANGNSWDVWGRTDETVCNPPSASFDIAAAQATNDNGTIGLTDDGMNPFVGATSKLKLAGSDNLTLAPGTYYFDSVLIAGQATLTITGPTEIYVSGSGVFTGGGVINVTENPFNLTIYSTNPTVDVRGASGFYGAIIAPNSNVDLVGTTDFYGTILGNTVNFNGTTRLHVDEALVQDMFNRDPVAPLLVD